MGTETVIKKESEIMEKVMEIIEMEGMETIIDDEMEIETVIEIEIETEIETDTEIKMND